MLDGPHKETEVIHQNGFEALRNPAGPGCRFARPEEVPQEDALLVRQCSDPT